MLYNDVKYLNLVSHKLLQFKQLDKYRWNFRCPFCGDSKISKTKARGNVYLKKNMLMFKCFNCQKACTIQSLIKYLDYTIYSEYQLENFKDTSKNTSEFLFKKEVVEDIGVDDVLNNIQCITTLDSNHPAVVYVRNRKIPESVWSRIYYVEKFKTWVNTLIPDKFKTTNNDDSRIILPYFDKHGKVYAISGRAINHSEKKYIHIKFDDSKDLIYGLDLVNYSRRVYVTEGQIDSMFISNCIAASGANFDIDTIQKIKTNATIIFDNERRNKNICEIIKKSIDAGFAVCLFPDTFKYKDINEAIIGGMKIEEIMSVINKNTYSGLIAQIEFAKWRRCDV